MKSINKRFGSTLALRDLSFSIKKGEVVGFVGPNGAGKTTTFNILSSYLLADEGIVRVAGYDIRKQRKQACQEIGYMPEKAPLPTEMRVLEFLTYRAKLKGLRGKKRKIRLDYVQEKTEITVASRKLIGQLSRGFRQRVALADALVADPKVLLLDEPTAGLDPVQQISFRTLLADLAKDRCVLLSSHVLSELSLMVSRFLVIHSGVLIADGCLETLRSKTLLSDGANAEEIFVALVENTPKEGA